MWNDDQVVYKGTYKDQVKIAERFVSILPDFTFDPDKVSMSSWSIELVHVSIPHAGLHINTQQNSKKFQIAPFWPSRNSGKFGTRYFRPELKKGEHDYVANVPKDATDDQIRKAVEQRILDRGYYGELRRQTQLMIEDEIAERKFDDTEKQFAKDIGHEIREFEINRPWRLSHKGIYEATFLHNLTDEGPETKIDLRLKSLPVDVAIKVAKLLEQEMK